MKFTEMTWKKGKKKDAEVSLRSRERWWRLIDVVEGEVREGTRKCEVWQGP